MGCSPSFFSIPFAPFWEETGGGESVAPRCKQLLDLSRKGLAGTVVPLPQKRRDNWGLFCSGRAREGRLEVSVKHRAGQRPTRRGFGLSPTQGVPTLADRRACWSSTGLGAEVRPHTHLPRPHPPPNPSSSPNELEKHLVFCIHSVNIYWVRHCAAAVVPSRRSYSPE